jgi:hypothetical protein
MSLIPDGWIELFHRTTLEAAETIGETRRFISKEHDGSVYFSNREHGQYGVGYGRGCVRVVMPADFYQLELDDEFEDGEMHYRIGADQIEPDWITLRSPTSAAIRAFFLDELREVITNEPHVRAAVQEIVTQARNMAAATDEDRAQALGEEIAELFTRPVPLITTYNTPLAAVARLVRRIMDHVDTDELGRHYLRNGA